jgi:hypothetical protein
MADPIRSNVLSNTCGEVTSSNCVAWAGPDLPGLGLCRGASMTDVIYSLNSNCCGNKDVVQCAANGWVNTPNPTFVSGSGCIITYLSSGTFSGWIASWSPIITDPPGYKYSSNGDIKLRGSFEIEFSTTGNVGHAILSLGNVDTTCFPSTFSKAQVVLTEVEVRDVQKIVQFMKAYAVLSPSGALQVYIYFDFGIFPTTYRWSISLGGVTFNLA